MMMNISSGKKQEGGDGQEMRKLGASTSRQWGGFKNPRIVRVSRSFGGKDRHSKVCTIRGLRDRRIRLSVPTAIQLYDLQDRLGLSQPSKVVDWLLDATKLEIDKLPPLHFPHPPPASFSQESLPPHLSHHNETRDRTHSGKEKWIEENQDAAAYNTNTNNNNGVNVVPQNFFPLGSHSCFPAAPLMNNNNNNNNTTLPPYYHWEPSSLSLAQFHDSQNNLDLPSIFPPPYMPPTLPEATHFHHLLTTPSTSSPHHHLIQNPLIPPTLHFISSPIKSYAKDLSSLPHNNPEKSSRAS